METEKTLTVRDKTQAALASVKENLIDRDREIEALFACALAGENAVLLGDPGTGKSMLARCFSHVIKDSNHFEWLLTKFSTPDEIFGPISLAALKSDQYKRVTDGKLPKAHTAFVDEIFKASGAILNTLLTVFNERKYHEGSTSHDVPLLFAVAASNEEPDEELAALWDRFLLRMHVRPVAGFKSFHRLLTLAPKPVSTMTIDEWKEAGTELGAIAIDPQFYQVFFTIRSALAEKGIHVSDRRAVKAMRYLQAVAYLQGDAVVDDELANELTPILCERPNQDGIVAEVIAKFVSSHVASAERIRVAIAELFQKLPDPKDATYSTKVGAAAKEAKKAIDQVEGLIKKSSKENSVLRLKRIQRDINSLAVEGTRILRAQFEESERDLLR